MRILIVDDMPENILLMQAMLQGAGYEVFSAGNGREALDILEKGIFDAIVSDILMPVMDGFQLCRECKNKPEYKDIPFIFYTATYTEKKDEDFTLSLGADRFIVKPQEPEQFLKIIADILKQPRLRKIPTEQESSLDEMAYLTEHNKRLVEKLERKMSQLGEAYKSLHASEKKYRLLAENAHDVIFTLDMDLKYIYVSPSVNLLRGYEPEEVIGQSVAATLTPDSWKLTASIFSEEMESERAGTADPQRSRVIELEMLRKDGTTIWTEVKVSLLLDEKHQPTGILGVSRDITQRKKHEEAVKMMMADLRKALAGTVHVIVKIIEARDPYTAGHERRVTDLACAIAETMGLEYKRIEGLRMAGMIHDLGKVAIPAEILGKPAKLTSVEKTMIEIHPQIGYEILEENEFPWPIASVVCQHHERLDGSGYPKGLKGDDIILEAKILSVADVVEAILSNRPYRPALGLDVALEEIDKNKGVLYDNNVVDACLKLFKEKGFVF